MIKISENRISEIIDTVLKESYYTDHMGNAQLQYKQRVAAEYNHLRDRLVDSIIHVIEDEYNTSNIKRQALSMLLEPVVTKVQKWIRQ